jgi:hypothetical protein
MTMTSDQIRKALAPMKDFAPAIFSCAEIVESAEVAEKRKAEAERETAKLQRVHAELLAQNEQERQKLAKYTREAEAAKPDSKRVRDLEARETSVMAREQSVLAREEAVLKREEKVKDLSDRLSSFTNLNS